MTGDLLAAAIAPVAIGGLLMAVIVVGTRLSPERRRKVESAAIAVAIGLTIAYVGVLAYIAFKERSWFEQTYRAGVAVIWLIALSSLLLRRRRGVGLPSTTDRNEP